MNLLDTVTTPDGPAKVVGFPDIDTVEVKYPIGGRLKIWKRGLIQDPVTPPAQDMPRGKTGKPLHGIALEKHLAKQRADQE